MRESFSVLGKPIPSIESREKSMGMGEYVTDVVLPGMLWGKILRSPLPHARILHVDTSRALAHRGVKAVLTGGDLPPIPIGHNIHDEKILAADKVRYAGDEVAAVAAVDLDAAEEALELIRVEYEELPFVIDPIVAMADGAPRIHEAERNIAKEGVIARGDVDRAMKEADAVVEETFWTSAAHQCYMEPMAAVAEFDTNGRLTLHLGIQDPWIVKHDYAAPLQMDAGDIRVVHTFIGGGFGSKKMQCLHLIAAWLARKAGRPVRIDNTREEEFLATHPRVPMKIWTRLGARRDGAFLAKDADFIADNGAYTNEALAITGIASYRMDNLYRLPNVRARYRLVYTNKFPTGGYRGFGNPQGAFALESAIDMLAERLGMDPAVMRMKNFVQSGDVTVHGWKLGSVGVQDCLERAEAESGWSQKRDAGGVPKDGKYRGIGVACCLHTSGFRGSFKDFDGSSATVRVDEDGRAYLLTGEVDLGQGSRTLFSQIVAEELGVGMEDIRVSGVDTDLTPMCLGAFATRTTTVGGHAVIRAARNAKEKILAHAAGELECRPEDLELHDGSIFVKGSPDRSVAFRAVARSMVLTQGGKPILGEGNFVPADVVIPDSETRFGNSSIAYPFAAQVAEVEVDAETGEVRVIQMWAAHDSGRILNRLTAEGQVEGGVLQGVGWALMEEFKFEGGRVANPNFYDYRVPTMSDFLPIHVDFVDNIEPRGPYGAKGLGEPCIVPTAAAIANAVSHAIGARVTSLPITAEKVLELLRARETASL
ncbi:MAG: xanthine dehydrogenase family protein molybdopterin-binding subunit [Nitrospinota bacterium]